MLLIDNIIMSPARGIMWIFREIHKVAEESLHEEYQSITADLSQLYEKLEKGEMEEEEFDIQEQRLLDRMEELEEQGYGIDVRQANDE
ncbi:gas vesicle protein GvpG [Methylohalobius crimeensis]|uniref:gas vesicle protein GvpG n=1 Tax=Methylohalobius crimeensis TaxID=244365 RepID=UPI0003B4A2BF|nr:gas vesicle protein GvpG [Methylohalobius crimeensis]